MGAIRTVHIGDLRRRVAVLGVSALLAFSAQLSLAAPASATPYTGGISPTIFDGLADLNGDGEVTGRDDSNAFYGDTAIIDGALDCDNWTSDNDGTAGDGVIDDDDDCSLIGYDGTADGAHIDVVDGVFEWPDDPLPTVFPQAGDAGNPDIGDSAFAWSTILGRVDSNGNEVLDPGDCAFGLIGETVDDGLGDATDGADVLANDGAESNPCGFGSVTGPDPADNGLVDLDSDMAITAADSCDDCFFGLDLDNGFVVGGVGGVGTAETLILTPASSSNREDTPQTVNALVEDSNGDRVAGVTVEFIVTGVNPTTGDAVTNVSGVASFTYTGANVGVDTITAFADSDGDANNDVAEPEDTATKTWTAAPQPPTCSGYASDPRNQVVGTAGPDELVGTAAADIICGRGGNDTVSGLGGNDVLLGGGGNDILVGGGDDDTLRGGGGADVFRGSEGADRLYGELGGDRLLGGIGNDRLFGQGGNDRLFGGPGRDHLDGGSGSDVGVGGTGRDTFIRVENRTQ